jgi:mono/diheme cytochrome c family protein
MRWLSLNGLLVAVVVIATASTLAAVRAFADTPPEEWKAPARATRRKNPIACDEKSIAAGKVVYAAQCLSCHGPTGIGDGPAAHDLNPKPSNLSDSAIQRRSDGWMFWKITEGKKPMPNFDKLISEDDRWNVINFVRTFAAKGVK